MPGSACLVPTGMATSRLEAALVRDPVIKAVEERIAIATGIPVTRRLVGESDTESTAVLQTHPHEDMLSFAKILPRGNTLRGGDCIPFGLHMDTDTRPNRARTLLIYLSDTHSGGRTVSPLCGANWPQGSPVSKEEFSEALGSVYRDDEGGFSRQAGFDETQEHPFNEILASACRGDLGASVTPRKATSGSHV